MSESKDPNDWDWYVGDPCYHIDNGRWDEFCDLLFTEEARIRKEIRARDPKRWQYEDDKGVTHQKYIPINDGVFIDWPIYWEDGTHKDDLEIEVWSSPYGDGCWPFSNYPSSLTYKDSIYVKGKDIPVDAGIIAIVPHEAIDEEVPPDMIMGLYFKGDRPTLETTENDFEVRVNDVTHDGIGLCWQCGREESHDQFYDCGSCFMCGPEEEEEEGW